MFKELTALGVVHAVAYSLLLLNTDLHVAELSVHMSRGQFVRNTMHAIQSQLLPSVGNDVTPYVEQDDPNSVPAIHSELSNNLAATLRPRSKRSGSLQSWKSISRDVFPTSGSSSTTLSTTQLQVGGVSDCSTMVPIVPESQGRDMASGPHFLNHRNWEIEVEGLLKASFVNTDWLSELTVVRTCMVQ